MSEASSFAAPLYLTKKNIEVIFKLKAVVEMPQSPLLLQLILMMIPKMELNIIYKLVHIYQSQDLLVSKILLLFPKKSIKITKAL